MNRTDLPFWCAMLFLLLPLAASAHQASPSQRGRGTDGGSKPDKAIEALKSDYEKRTAAVGERDIKGRMELAKWCMEKHILFAARREYDKVLAVDADNTEARQSLGWKQTDGKWELDYALLAKDIRFVRDPVMDKKYGDKERYARDSKYLEDRKTPESVLRRIHERIGLHRMPGELDITVRLSDGVPNQATAFTRSHGYTGPGNAVRVTIEINPEKLLTAKAGVSVFFVDSVILHECVHALMEPAMDSWPVWLREGSACFVTREEFQVSLMIGKPLKDVDDAWDRNAAISPYGTGYLFLRYVEKTLGADKLHEFVKRSVIDREPYRDAFSKASGKAWAALKIEQAAFAKDYVAKYAKRFSKPPDDVPFIGLYLGWDGDDGMQVVVVRPGFGAAEGGVREQDYITMVDGRPMMDVLAFMGYLSAEKRIGDAVTLTVIRDGKEMELKCTLKKREGNVEPYDM